MKIQYARLLQSKLFVDNQWVNAGNGSTFKVKNPANGKTVMHVSNASAEDTYQAVTVAHNAFQKWATMPAKERGAILLNWYQLILRHVDDLALILTMEQGKPFAEAKGEVQYGASFIQWFAEECRRTYGDIIPSPDKTKRIQTIRQPLGVVAAITPWNFPVAMITRKVAPAIAAGNTIVLKPAEDTPLSALALAQLALDAGLPNGVFNVIPSDNAKEVGNVLCNHPQIQKLSFTGSTEVGRILMQQCAPTLKRLALELGGNAPFIVFDDADIDAAVKGGLASKYRNAGQTCICTNRFFVQKTVLKSFVDKMKKAVGMLVVGVGTQPNVMIGPLINVDAIEKVESLVKDAVDKGASVVLGGERSEAGALFYQPTILTGCTEDMRLHQEEIFGPVAAIYTFDTEDDAIRMANNTEYGLAAYFYTENIKRATRVSEALEYGIVGVNEGLVSYAEAPFGGIKQSGFGREGSHEGIADYLDTKYICIGGM